MNEIENQNQNLNSMADKELKEIAEKLEKELGHQYFDKPVDLTTGKTQEKNPELLELEKEMENLGKIILPGADLKPRDELPAGEQILALEEKEENKPEKIKYKSFRLFQGKTDEEKNADEQQKKLQTEKQAQEKIMREQEKEKALAEKAQQKEIEKQEKEKAEKEKKLWQELERQKNEERKKAALAEKQKQEAEKNLLKKQEQEKKEKEEQEKKLLEEQQQEKENQEKIARQIQKEKEMTEWKKIKAERDLAKIEKKNKRKQERLLKKEQRKKERALRPKFGWYVTVIKRPVVYLCAIEFMAYFGALLPFVKNFFTNVILSYIIILDLIVFVWLAARIKKHYAESYSTAIKAVMLAGLLTGFFRAVFKVIWINEPWAIFNVIFEPLIWAGYGLVIGLVVGGIIKRPPRLSFPTPHQVRGRL